MFNPVEDPPGYATGLLECMAGVVFFPSVFYFIQANYVRRILCDAAVLHGGVDQNTQQRVYMYANGVLCRGTIFTIYLQRGKFLVTQSPQLSLPHSHLTTTSHVCNSMPPGN